MVTKGCCGELSPDGRWLTYRNDEKPKHLFLRDLQTGKARDLGLVYSPAWSPDATTLALWDDKQLLLLGPAGGEPRRLALGDITAPPSFSPDGKAIVVSTEDDLSIVRLADARVTRLTDGHGAIWGLSWIAFNRWRFLEEYKDYGSVSDLYLIRADGSGVHQLTIKEETTGHGKDGFLRFGLVPLVFSADGKRLLARVSIELGSSELVTFAVPEGPGRKLTDAEQEGAIWTADLSPDGTRVLFEDGALDDEQNHAIFTMPFEGGERRMLIRNATQASWARGIPPSRDDMD